MAVGATSPRGSVLSLSAMKSLTKICWSVWLLLIGLSCDLSGGDQMRYGERKRPADSQAMYSERLGSLTLPVPQPNCPPVKVRNPEGNYIIPGVMGEIVYRRVNSVELSLDAYIQKRGNKRPAVVVVHGGNWDSGSRVSFVGQFLELLTAACYNWFSIDYR
ncbi:MAG: hypothetical protein ACRD82_16190, partial [Blastocatellia bacterium]